MTLVIGCDSFLSLRNVRNGELGVRLAPELVVALVDPKQLPGSLEVAPSRVTVEPLLQFDFRSDPQLEEAILRSYNARKSYYDPHTQWLAHRRACYARNCDNRLRLYASLARARLDHSRDWLEGRRGNNTSARERTGSLLRQHANITNYLERFEIWGASAVCGFSLEGPREMLLMEAANAAGLPTAVMIRSRDNLQTKIVHLPLVSAYFVWSEHTKRVLLHLYPETPPDRVIVTGSPQFDRHRNPAFRLDRDEFFRRIGLDPDRPLVLYTGAMPDLIPYENRIVASLAHAASNGTLANRAQLLVRPHPRTFGSDHSLLAERLPNVAQFPEPGSHAYLSDAHESSLIRLILEDEPMHLAALAYQDVQVNVAGTMTVDSAVLDKPIVNIYDDFGPVPRGLSVKGFYDRSDYRPVLETGAVDLATGAANAIELINSCLTSPDRRAAGRRRLVDLEVGTVDGHASERLAAALANLTD